MTFSSSKLDNILAESTATSTENRLPLAIGAVATKDKGLVYLGSSGSRDVTNPEKTASTDTVVAFYSCTKAVASTAMLQLIERGVIGLDDLVEKYIPEFAEKQILKGFTDKDEPILETPKNKATIRHLITHTAGLGYTFFNKHYHDLKEKTGVPNILTSEYEHFDTPLLFEPGTKWLYGTNMDIAGKVLYNVTGKSLGDYCKENIFDKINAPSLTFVKTDEQCSNEAEIHQRSHNTYGDLIPLYNIHPRVAPFHAGGHGLFGKVEDYLKFLQIFINDGNCKATGEQILKPETVQNFAFENLLPADVTIQNDMEYPELELSNPVTLFDQLPADKQWWTGAFMKVGVELPTGRSAGSVFWCGLPNLYYWIDYKKGIVGMFATQLFPFYDATALKYSAEFESEAYKQFCN